MQIENEQQPVVDEEQAVQPEAEEAAAETEEDQKKKKAEHIKKEIISWILTLGVAVVAALVIRTFLFEPIRVDGQSMCDTLQDGETTLVTKPDYLIADP